MLNVKQKSCEYQLLKSFDLTRPGNRILVYRLLGERSNQPTKKKKIYFENQRLVGDLRGYVKGLVHCFSLHVVMNKCSRRAEGLRIGVVIFEIIRRPRAEGLRLGDVIFGIIGAFISKTTRQICAKIFFQGLGKNICSLQPALKSNALGL